MQDSTKDGKLKHDLPNLLSISLMYHISSSPSPSISQSYPQKPKKLILFDQDDMGQKINVIPLNPNY
jgi:hypothetical protein